MARVVVIGGGITGLTAALELARHDGVEVVVLEADTRVGGHIRTSPFAGRPAIDESADAFLARVRYGTELAAAVGLGDELTSPTTASAAVWHGRLHPIPEGIVLGVPADLVKLAASPLLTWRGKVRAGVDVVLPGRNPADSIGALIRHRFGDEVHDRLVDALVGTIYAADTDRFSLAMVPQLAALAAQNRSLLLGARRTRRAGGATSGPVFYAPIGGMGALVEATAAKAGDAGAIIKTGTRASVVVADGPRWRVDDDVADAVVVAAPASQAAAILRAHTDLAQLLGRIDTAGVALVSLAIPCDDWPERLTGTSGYLVPKSVQRRVTAVSFGTQKWEHWADGRTEILRVSIGRDGAPIDDLHDERLVTTAVDEVNDHLGLSLQPSTVRVSRFPAAFPQYRPGHRQWLDDVDRACPPGLALAGASYRGIGIPSCIEQGELAAAAAARHVTGARQ